MKTRKIKALEKYRIRRKEANIQKNDSDCSKHQICRWIGRIRDQFVNEELEDDDSNDDDEKEDDEDITEIRKIRKTRTIPKMVTNMMMKKKLKQRRMK